MRIRTFAHVRTTSDLALVLWTGGINPPTKLKKTRGLKRSGISDDFLEKILEAPRLRTEKSKSRSSKRKENHALGG